jgi:peptide deformylase
MRLPGRYDGVARPIVTYGSNPVLHRPCAPVTQFDEGLRRLVLDMFASMEAADGVGLAANQIGVQKRLFVWDIGDSKGVAINPRVEGHTGEWVYDEGCLSVPGLFWPIARPQLVRLTALDLDGNEFSIDADEMEARVFLHETDHLDGILLLERLDAEQRRQAKRELRGRVLDLDPR